MSGNLSLASTQGRWVLATTALGSGLALLDSTVVNVALGRMGRELNAGFSGLQWTINGYTLTLASLILLGGSLGDRFGRRKVFLIGVAWFALASLLCGLAPNIGLLIAARALQGIGGALLTPGSLAIISASFRPEDRTKAVGAWSGLGGVAGAIGPFVGGWLVEWTWRAVFLINLPFAVLIIAVALRHVPETKDPEASGRLDIPGTVLCAAGLAGLTFGLTAIGDGGLAPRVVVALAVGVLALAAFVAVQRRSHNPLMPPDLFVNAQFSGANVTTLLFYGAIGTVFFLVVLQLQVVTGFSPLAAGTAMLPVTALMLVLSARAGALAQRIGPRLPMTFGPLVCMAGLLLMLRVGPGADYLLDVLPAVIVFGLGLSLTVAPLTATVLDAAEERHAGVASGVNNAIARAAGQLAVAVVPVAAGIAGRDYENASTFDAGFDKAMLIGAGMFALASLVSFTLVHGRLGEPTPPRQLRLEQCAHCGVSSPQSYPPDWADDRPATTGSPVVGES